MDERKNIITCPHCGMGHYDGEALWFWRGMNSCSGCGGDFCVVVREDGVVLVEPVEIVGGVL